jgi:hypothetical protein
MRPAVLSKGSVTLTTAVQDGFWEQQRTFAQRDYPDGPNADLLDISWEARVAATPLALGGYTDAALFDRHNIHKENPVRREHGKQLLQALDNVGEEPLLLNALLVTANDVRGLPKGDYLLQPFPEDLSANSILEAIHGGHHVSLPDATMFGLMGYRAMSSGERFRNIDVEEVVRGTLALFEDAQMILKVPYLQKEEDPESEGPARWNTYVRWGEVGMEGHVLGIENEHLALRLGVSRLMDENMQLHMLNAEIGTGADLGYIRRLAEALYHAHIVHMKDVPDLDWGALSTEQIREYVLLVLAAIEPPVDDSLPLFDGIVQDQIFPGNVAVQVAGTGEGPVKESLPPDVAFAREYGYEPSQC